MIKTERLILRPWQESDFEPFARMNADHRVRKYFPSVLTEEESNALAEKIILKIQDQGWGFWAVSAPGIADFIGFIGLAVVEFKAPFTPAVEIGWRLAHEFWGQGYATEGALAALNYGFEILDLKEIVSFTTEKNLPSRKVMEKIGMHRDSQDDFDHPNLFEGHVLRRHVLYRLSINEWSTYRKED